MASEELVTNAALVAPLAAWRGRPGNVSACGCQALPLPHKWNVRANTQLQAVAPVTNCSQAFAVVPVEWGEDFSGSSWNVFDALKGLEAVARALDKRGDCAVVRTHRAKIHFLSKAQMLVASR